MAHRLLHAPDDDFRRRQHLPEKVEVGAVAPDDEVAERDARRRYGRADPREVVGERAQDNVATPEVPDHRQLPALTGAEEAGGVVQGGGGGGADSSAPDRAAGAAERPREGVEAVDRTAVKPEA